jgi:hypothetical protein
MDSHEITIHIIKLQLERDAARNDLAKANRIVEAQAIELAKLARKLNRQPQRKTTDDSTRRAPDPEGATDDE